MGLRLQCPFLCHGSPYLSRSLHQVLLQLGGTCLLFDHHLSFAHSCMEQVKLGSLGPGLEGAAVTTKTMGQYLSVHISYAFSSFVIVYNRNLYLYLYLAEFILL